MKILSLSDKARLLWTRRNDTISVWTSLRQNAKRHLFYTALFWSAIVLCWLQDVPTISFLLFGYWLGRLSRDIAWYRRLSIEWTSTRDLLDWPKIRIPRRPSRTPTAQRRQYVVVPASAPGKSKKP
jgi:hypothetical protein